MIENDKLIFANETDIKKDKDTEPWKILIADDEMEVHVVTRMVLSDFTFEGRRLEFLSAYSGEETKKIIQSNPDVAVMLLDVVMEDEISGLLVARYVRENLENNFVRIILRTGQPGRAPERKVIREFDINDYKEKTELTTQKLYTSLTSALRSYRDLKLIDKNRKSLQHIVSAGASLFEPQSLERFTKEVLKNLAALFSIESEFDPSSISGLALIQNKINENNMDILDMYTIFAGIGRYADFEGKDADGLLSPEIRDILLKALKEKQNLFAGNVFVGYFRSKSRAENLIYIECPFELKKTEKNLIQLFSNNVAVAFDNIYLSNDIEATQKEVIFTLGAIVESRSRETGNHVRRVADYSFLLACKAGLSLEEANILRLASPMHDVGKLGVPDAILNKPAKLSDEEFDIIKTHTTIGYEILKGSSRRILQTAATITLQHHERWDGEGYPYGLKAEKIHIFGRITGLADVFDALLHKRVYKDNWDNNSIKNYLLEERGRQFDPSLVDIIIRDFDEFLAVKDRYPD